MSQRSRSRPWFRDRREAIVYGLTSGLSLGYRDDVLVSVQAYRDETQWLRMVDAGTLGGPIYGVSRSPISSFTEAEIS